MANGDLWGEDRVDSASEATGNDLGGGLKARHLAQGVHAPVGSAGRHEAHGVAGYVLERLLERACDGPLVRLDLPSSEGLAFVFDE